MTSPDPESSHAPERSAEDAPADPVPALATVLRRLGAVLLAFVIVAAVAALLAYLG